MDIPEDQVARIQAQWRRERPDLDVGPQGVIGRLHRLAQRLTVELTAVYAEHGLTEGEFDVLATLRRIGPPFQRGAGDLASQTMITTGGMTKRIDRLEQSGLVSRVPSPDDGRGRLVSLTPKGRALIDAAFTDHMRNERRLLEGVPESERGSLEAALRGWLSTIEADVADGTPPS